MSDITDKVKEQVEKANGNFSEIITAGRGLLVKLKDESNKQYKELVQLGEKTTEEEDSLFKDFLEMFESPFKDVKGTTSAWKFASLGLLLKMKSDGQAFYNELVELGKTDSKTDEVATQ